MQESSGKYSNSPADAVGNLISSLLHESHIRGELSLALPSATFFKLIILLSDLLLPKPMTDFYEFAHIFSSCIHVNKKWLLVFIKVSLGVFL